MVSFATTQFHHCSGKAPKDISKQMSMASVPIKLYLHRQAASQTWPMQTAAHGPGYGFILQMRRLTSERLADNNSRTYGQTLHH